MLLASLALLMVGLGSGAPTARGDSTIAYSHVNGGGSDVYTMPASGGAATAVTNDGPSGVDNGHPAWSTDGTKLAYESTRGGNNAIWVVTGSTHRQLAFGHNPAWSPDGTRIVFDSDRTGNTEIWVMNADGSAQTQLTANVDAEWLPAWSPAGDRIAYVRNSRLWTMNPDGSGQAAVLPFGGSTSDPTWSPGGGSIAYIEDGGLETLGADGDESSRMTLSPGNTGDRGPTWSWDGTTIMVTAPKPLQYPDYELFTFRSGGPSYQTPTPVPNSDGDWDPSYRPDTAAAVPVAGQLLYQPTRGGPVGAGVDPGCSPAPAVGGEVMVPGGATVDSTYGTLLDDGTAFVPQFDADTEPTDNTVDGTAGPPTDAAGDPTGGSVPTGDPDPCADGPTVTKVNVGAAHTAKVTCYLDVSNPPNSEVFPPKRVTFPLKDARPWVRVGGYSSCTGSTHGSIHRYYEICAQRKVQDAWHKMKKCRSATKSGFGSKNLGHDTRCTADLQDLPRRTFVRMWFLNTYTKEILTKHVVNPHDGVNVSCVP